MCIGYDVDLTVTNFSNFKRKSYFLFMTVYKIENKTRKKWRRPERWELTVTRSNKCINLLIRRFSCRKELRSGRSRVSRTIGHQQMWHTCTRDSGRLIFNATSSRMKMSGYRVFWNSDSRMSSWERENVVRSRLCFLLLADTSTFGSF